MIETPERIGKERLGAVSADALGVLLALALLAAVVVLAEQRRGEDKLSKSLSEPESNGMVAVPLTAGDPLWGIVALGKTKERTDLSEHVDDCLAEEYHSDLRPIQ